jgi:lysophospholipase L1-like esterase
MRQVITAGLIVIAAALSALATAAVAQAAPGERYVALGDSYTAGPLVLTPTGNPIDCARSDHNYPSVVAERLGVSSFTDVSCSSAETKHMTEPQTGLPLGGTNPPQFNGLRPDTTLVTVGIGGNDAGLVGVAVECAQLGLLAPTGSACRDHYAPGGVDSVEAKIEAARPRIDAVLEGIHARSPDARVAIVGYPNVLPIDGSNCYPLVPLSRDDVTYIDMLMRRINTMIRQEAAKHDAEFVDTYDDAIGHDVCKLPPTRWFEGLVPTEPAFPLHPNGKGEASMARSVLDVLRKPPPIDEGPTIDGLRVRPRPVRRGDRAVIRFRLDRDATVRLVHRRVGGDGGSRPVRGASGPAEAGVTKLRVSSARLGAPGRYRLVVRPRAAGSAGEPARAPYRVAAG